MSGVKTLGRTPDDCLVADEGNENEDSGVNRRVVRALVKLGERERAVSVLKRCLQD